MWIFHKYSLLSIGARKLAVAFAMVAGIAVGMDDFLRRETRIITPCIVLRGHEYWVRAIAWAPDGKTLASAGGIMPDTAELKIWNLETGTEQASLQGHTGLIESAVFSPDGRTLVSSSRDRTIRHWDVATCKERALLHGHTNTVPFLAFSPDGKTLASACRDNTVRLWNVTPNGEPTDFRHPAGWAYCMLFDADGPVMVTYGERDPKISVWDVRQARERASFPKPPRTAQCMALSSVGQVLVAGCTDGSVYLWDMAGEGQGVRGQESGARGQESELSNQEWGVTSPASTDSWPLTPDPSPLGLRSCSWQAHEDLVTAIALSPDGRYIASGGRDGLVKLWEVSTGKEAGILEGHTAPVIGLAFSPDGKKIASGSYDKTVAVWEVR